MNLAIQCEPMSALNAIYPNPDERSSGKIGPDCLVLAAAIARQVGLPQTWPNVQTIKLAIQSEAAFSDISIEKSADLILEAAKECTHCKEYSCPSQWEIRELFRDNTVNRFWFEDGRWRAKRAYTAFLIARIESAQ
jgi:hypothetical protein